MAKLSDGFLLVTFNYYPILSEKKIIPITNTITCEICKTMDKWTLGFTHHNSSFKESHFYCKECGNTKIFTE